MSDTQWPRYEVFIQDKPDQPHRSVGTVHAPDAELALLNARNVFVRRPDCLSLWVVPSSAIFARTADELAVETGPATSFDGPDEVYYVFQKQSQRRAMTYVVYSGEVRAASPAQALAQARASFASDRSTYVWWVCPATAVARTDAADVDSMFAPARDKPYKQPSQYRTLTALRKVRADEEG